jgi:hypothetical protein
MKTRSSQKQTQQIQHEEYPSTRNFRSKHAVTGKRTVKLQDVNNPINLVNQIKRLNTRIKNMEKNEENLKDIIETLSKKINHAEKYFGDAWKIIMDLYEDPENESIEVKIIQDENNEIEINDLQDDKNDKSELIQNKTEEISEVIQNEIQENENNNSVILQNENNKFVESFQQIENEVENFNIYNMNLNNLANLDFTYEPQYFFNDNVYNESVNQSNIQIYQEENIPESPNYDEFLDLNNNILNDLNNFNNNPM